MTESDVHRIESLLALTLPDDYRHFLLAYPRDMPRDVGRHEIFESADAIISETQVARSGVLGEENWPEHMLVIAHSGCGDYYCLDLSEEPASVVCWNHETGAFALAAASIERWHRKVRAIHVEEVR